MATINDPNTAANILAVGEKAGTVITAAIFQPRPINTSLGAYRFAARIGSTAAQAANSRLLEIRNSHATNLCVITRLVMVAIQTAAGTAQENSLDAYRLTSFTALDTTNTTTITPSQKRTSGMSSATSNGVDVRVLNPNAAGMTGGTLTKDAQALSTFPYLVNTAVPTTPNAIWGPKDVFDDNFGTYPLTLGQNEGIDIENRVLNVTSFGFTWYFECAFTIVAAY